MNGLPHNEAHDLAEKKATEPDISSASFTKNHINNTWKIQKQDVFVKNH